MKQFITMKTNPLVVTNDIYSFLCKSIKHIRIFPETAKNKYPCFISKGFKFGGQQIPKNAIIALNPENNLMWVCSHVSSYKGRKCNMKYMYVSCYDFDTLEWEQTIIGNSELSISIYDCLIKSGRLRPKYQKEEGTFDDYVKMMKHSRKKKKSSGGQKDRPYAMTDTLCHGKALTDEAYWSGGERGSLVASNIGKSAYI